MKTILYLLIGVFVTGCKEKYFRAPTGSMEGTIRTGEKFYVTAANKFERNNIVVFNYFGEDYASLPEDGKFKLHWEKRVYRLMAFSGDTLLIKDGEVFINNRPVPLPATALCEYDVLSKVEIDDFPEWQGGSQAQLISSSNDTLHYITMLTKAEAMDYSERKPAIISVKKKLFENIPEDSLYAKNTVMDKWSSDNYGPLVIPNTGNTVIVDSINYKLYHNIPGIRMGKNTIEESLYFVLGDNRHGAQDSRFIGFIPHSNMYGIVK